MSVTKMTAEIRKWCDDIDSQVIDMRTPTEADKQLEYVLTCLSILEKRFNSIINRSGNRKSYATEVSMALHFLQRLNRDISLWQAKNVLPEALKDSNFGS